MDNTESVEETLNRLQDEISSLESTKSTLLLQLESIDSSLSHLKAKYGTWKNRGSLVGGLPSEILAKIFEVGRDLNTAGGEQFEVLVSQVTSVWREVALGTPTLWNILEIAPSQSAHMLTTYITRAKACSLELRFNFLQEVWVPDQSVWDVILPTVDRWRSLEICTQSTTDDAMLYTTLGHLEPFKASLLEEITIVRGHRTNLFESAIGQLHGFRNSVYCFHAGAPRLQKLYLEGSYLSSNWPPTANLTTLYLHNLRRSTRPSWNRFRDLLVSSLQLSHLSIQGDVVSGKPLDHLEIEMPHLRSLRIRGTTALGNRASDVLLAISAPCLKSLTLFDVVHTDLDPWLSGFQLLQSVTALTLYWPNFTTATYLKLFQMMPSISRLTLMDRQPEDVLLFLGNPTRQSSDFPCPQLTDLALYPGNSNHADIEGMVGKRADHAPLQVLRLGGEAPVPGVQVLPFDLPPPWPAWPEQMY